MRAITKMGRVFNQLSLHANAQEHTEKKITEMTENIVHKHLPNQSS